MPPESMLRDALREPVSTVVHQALMDASAEAEVMAGRGRGGLLFRRLSRRAAAVIAAVTLSSAVVAAAAIPFALDVLFPPPVSTSFTFESGVVCDIDIKVTPDFASNRHPEASMDVAQRFVRSLDIAALPIQHAIDHPSGERSAMALAEEAAKAAREAAGLPEPTPDPHWAEAEAVSSAVTAAIRAELADKGMEYGVSIETGTQCR
ncbi:hypothetical protein GCM10027029_25660 [Conyzicola lurida]